LTADNSRSIRESLKRLFHIPLGDSSHDMNIWRRDLINFIITMTAVIVLPINYVITFPSYIKNGQFELIIIDVLLLSLFIFHLLSRGRTFFRHGYVWLIVLYLLTLFFYHDLGPNGVRPAWFVLTSVFFILFYGLKAIPSALILNILLLSGLYLSADAQNPFWAPVLQAPLREFIVYVANLNGLILVTTSSVALLISRFNTTLIHRRDMLSDLESEKSKLAAANADLKSEIQQREKEVQARLRSELNFRNIFDSAINGIGIVDKSGKLIDVNRELLKISGYTKTEMVGMPVVDFISPTSIELIEDRMKEAVAGMNTAGSFKIQCLRKDGSAFPALIRGWTIKDPENRVNGLGFFLSDISRQETLQQEKRTLEKQLMHNQKMEAIGTLAGGIAHDFNNIITGIYGNSELALAFMDESTEQSRDFIRRSMEATNRARELVQQILKFSRRNDENFEIVRLLPIVEEVRSLMAATLPANIRISLDNRSAEDHILADSTQIHQIVMNLCTNAYHAMKEKGGSLDIILENIRYSHFVQTRTGQLDPGAYISLSIRDTGSGIKPEIVDRIFEPYFTTKAKNEGTGLGLSVTLGIIQNHRGGLNLSSSAGFGSEFQILLPLRTEVGSTEKKHEEPVPKGKNELVCIVDDEKNVVDLFDYYLSSSNYRTVCFTHPEEALEFMLENPSSVQLLITDQNMPDLMGIQLVRELRTSLEPGLKILMTTGYSDIVDSDNYGQFGIDALLEKPLNRSLFMKTVRALLDRE